MFQDRDDAARQLGKRLAGYANHNPLVLAIPRGAVPMGKVIADLLGGDLDVVLVRKLQAPHQPELAIGAVAENGWTYVADFAKEYGADPEYIATEKKNQLTTIQRRRAQYSPIHPPLNPAGRIVIVVDDGLATGATMVAALHAVRSSEPARLVCAVPIAPPESLGKVSPLADEVICLEVSPNFQSVGQFYRNFHQVEDAEVVQILARSQAQESHAIGHAK